MLKTILYCLEKLFVVILSIASGFGFFLITSYVVYEVWGERYLTAPAYMVFFLGGQLLSIGIIKLIEFIQYEEIHIEAKEIEEEMSMDEETKQLIEHLRVK